MLKRQWLTWGALIALISFASYSYGALHQSKHALAATGATVLTTLSTSNPANHTITTATGAGSAAVNPNSVQIQVGQPESLQQWEGLPPTTGSSPASSTPNLQANPASSSSAEPNPNPSLSSTLSGILQSFGIPVGAFTVQGGESYLHSQLESVPLSGIVNGQIPGKGRLFGDFHGHHHGHDH